MRIFLAGLLTLISCASANAQDRDLRFIERQDVLGMVRFARVAFSDQIDGSCWTNVASVESRVRLLLQQNDVQVLDESIAFEDVISPRLHVTGVGFRNGAGTCAASVTVSLEARVGSRFGGSDGIPEFHFSTNSVLFTDLSVFTAGTNLNDVINDFVTGSVSELLVRILSGRRDPIVRELFLTLPNLLEEPMTSEAFRQFLEDNSSQ